MIIPSQHASRVARAAAGGGGGVTPNAVNWANAVPSGNQSFTRTAMLQITGITQTITVRVVHSGGATAAGYSVNSTSTYGAVYPITSNGTFTISNNQYLGFQASIQFSGGATQSFTITNVSDANAVLDTFTISVQFEEE